MDVDQQLLPIGTEFEKLQFGEFGEFCCLARKFGKEIGEGFGGKGLLGWG